MERQFQQLRYAVADGYVPSNTACFGIAQPFGKGDEALWYDEVHGTKRRVHISLVGTNGLVRADVVTDVPVDMFGRYFPA